MSEEIVEEEVLEEEETIEETSEPEAEEPGEEIDWKARAEKAEALIVKNKKAKAEPTNPTPDTTDEVPEWGKKILSSEEKRSFGYAKKFAPETVDALFKYNGGSAPTDEQLESDDAMKGIVRTLEAKVRVTANTPSGGSTPTYKGKTYAETATDPDATPADKQAAMEATAKRHGIT